MAKLGILLLGLAWLAGCTTTRTAYVPSPEQPVEVEERVIVDGTALPLPEEPEIRSQPLPEQNSESPVVKRLMASANTQVSNGDPDAAANSLERAIRIEPRNATLWNRLAEVRFSQQNWQQAIQFAARSNTFTGSNLEVRRRNWNLMASAYDALGDPDNAQKYRDKLRPTRCCPEQ